MATAGSLDEQALARERHSLLIELVKLSVIGACAPTEKEAASGSSTVSGVPQ